MKRNLIIILLLLPLALGAKNKFVDENRLKSDIMNSLSDFSRYLRADFDVDNGVFKGENTMMSDEKGVRTNADLSMISAFLCRYGHGVSPELKNMAKQSLDYAVSTHKAVKLKACRDGKYWGSVSKNDNQWESSLWAMSVAYSAFFQWDDLSKSERDNVYKLLKSECNYELERDIPTGYIGDTKAEENGWEVDVLAAALGLFPDDALAPKWFERMREFAINSYSHSSDSLDNTVIDPNYDQTRVKDLYRGQNLYNDYTLQNHGFFHISYQNVVIQELGEAALALRLFQGKKQKWHSNALLHNCQKVNDEVLNWFSLHDGEQAMPNGNDWSMFLYDQITSYSTLACMLPDNNVNALALETKALNQILRRQQTTSDGSYLLRADVGARRMGVEAHRLMMTWLMHHCFPVGHVNLNESLWWADFGKVKSKFFPNQNVVCSYGNTSFSCFSWSNGRRSYTGYFAPLDSAHNNIVVPFTAHNTGNFIGWLNVDKCKTNAVPLNDGTVNIPNDGKGWNYRGELLTNDSSLLHKFNIVSTKDDKIVFSDSIIALRDVEITGEFSGLLAISMDPFTATSRHFVTENDSFDTDGAGLRIMNTGWVNIDNCLSVITPDQSTMAFGDITNNNSILTAKLYPLYNDKRGKFNKGELVANSRVIYICNTTAEQTRILYGKVIK
ncbi:hypothetical protein [Prevotella sp.]|uniref:hypothetical protein n=1 Tax=Prevotella sp. TaxID=59823 RepID=UPI003DA27612